MSQKRSRATFEAELQSQQSPYVLFGTPLPPLDPDVRDDGSYVPVWKQEVRDERGRKRLHGAFTGGFSAGYFNTVGSKEGWTPSTFVSSRAKRRKDDAEPKQQRPEDFMDEEDLADAAEAQKLQTAQGFAGLGSTDEDRLARHGGGLSGLFRAQGETMGVKLLKRMGWKEGQGIGPKIRRAARLGVDSGTTQNRGETHLFAPDNVSMISFIKKLDRKGLGYEGEPRLTSTRPSSKAEAGSSSDEDSQNGPLIRPSTTKKRKPSKFAKGGIGIGILNDTGSDDEDPYEIGPRISYNRVIGGDKKKKKAASATTSANPTLRSAPVFISRKNALAQAGKNLRKCYDGRLPLDGFVFSGETDDLASTINTEVKKYPPPEIPADWKSSRQRKTDADTTSPDYISAADAAKASKLDPKSRAALLGEAQLPGKSVFDFLSASARERLAAATGKANLPPALGEIPDGYAPSEAERQQQLARQIPELDKATAAGAIARGAGGGAAPYADDGAKRARYRAYLEWAAGFAQAVPARSPGVHANIEDWLRELHEFRSCARIFKPMTGAMASRFTTSSSSSSSSKLATGSLSSGQELLSKPPPKPLDPMEEAARVGMYGATTRSVADFYPSRLLCKRLNVRPPAHVLPGHEKAEPRTAAKGLSDIFGVSAAADAAMTLDELLRSAQTQVAEDTGGASAPATKALEAPPVEAPVDAEVNDALEGKRAGEDVLRAVFGDSSDDDGD
ncbi:DUF1604-domain-containing protein [Jackrogersella minutella]|nr:DUF1604-domain-containing protein [Jackrogersella minutella]